MRVSFLNVSYQYPKEASQITALVDVSLCLEAAQCTVLLGASGAGKSTLLQLAAGALEPTQGRIQVELEAGGAATESKVGLVLQQPERHFFRPSVFDEVAIGVRWSFPGRRRWPARNVDEAVERQRVLGALAAMDLPADDYADRRPRTLSGGEQRRLALACSLALEPGFLALDEPLAGLDGSGRRAVVDTIRRLCASGTGVLVTAHELDPLLSVAHRVLALRAGRVVLDVPLERLMEAPDLLRTAGLEPWRLAIAGGLLQERGLPLPDWSSPEAFAASLLERPSAASSGT